MTSRQENPRQLIVVATCWYADRGSGNDEFCRQWGLDIDADHAWLDKPNPQVLLLVLHGYKDGENTRDVADVIRAAMRQRSKGESLAKEAWFCHHSLVGATAENDILLETAIERAGNAIIETFQVRGVKPVRYRSAGGLAVTQLVLALRAFGTGTPHLLADAVEKAAGGRMVFVERLRGVQSGLFRLRLMLEAGWKKELNKQDTVLLEDAMAACRIPDGGRFGDWMGILTNTRDKDPDVAGAISLLSILGGQTPARLITERQIATPRPKSGVWGSLNSSGRLFLQKSKNASVAVIEDIRLFSRAVDILLTIAETLPPVVTMTRNKSTSRVQDA